MMNGFRLYGRYVSVAVRCVMAYRGSFFLGLLSRFLAAFRGLIALGFLFSGFAHIKGYAYADVLLCYAVIELSFAIAECVSSGFASFAAQIRRGGFDTVLVRPRSAMLQVLGAGFELERSGAMISALLALGLGLHVHPVAFTPMRMAALLLMIAGGAGVFVGLFMLGAAICFFAVEESSALNLFTYGGRDHGKYPIDVYGKGLFRFCTFVIPYTLVQYYPLQYLTGRSENWHLGLYPIGSLLFLGACCALWRLGVRHYASTGS
ncbi:MAG: ABC-2 family transporter protein [Clostridia bacterium]|nr:ABC-2 family transporter protein [Clostridia bacterium]